MKKYDNLNKKLDESVAGAKGEISNFRKIADEAGRISQTAKDANIIIYDIDRQFEKATKFSKIDIGFLFLAVALQVFRQYLITNFKERLPHDKAAEEAKIFEKKVLGKETKLERLDRMDSTHSWYRPSLQEVIFNPVPFDQTAGLEGLGGAFDIDQKLRDMMQYLVIFLVLLILLHRH